MVAGVDEVDVMRGGEVGVTNVLEARVLVSRETVPNVA